MTGGLRSQIDKSNIAEFGPGDAKKALKIADSKYKENRDFYSAGSPIAVLNYINSDEYKNKFSSVSDDKEINALAYNYCKAAVTHQSGGYYEDLSVVSLATKKLIEKTSSKLENETLYSDELNMAIFAEPKYSLFAVHNHGTNLPPSGADFGSSGYRRYAFGLVACHDGKVYYYSTKNAKPFLATLIDSEVDKIYNV